MIHSTDQQKILIIRFSSMGDIALTLPVLDEIEKKYGKKSVVYLTKRLFAPLIEHHPAIESVMFLDNFPHLSELRKKIKKDNYTKILDLHTGLRSLRITFGLSPVIRYKKYRFQRFLLTRFKIHFGTFKHVSEKYLDTLIDSECDFHKTKIPLPPQSNIRPENEVLYKQVQNSQSILGISLGASKPSKMYPLEKMKKVLDSLENEFDYLVFFGQGKEEEDIVNQVAKADNTKHINLVSKLSISELLLFTKELTAFIGNDSGPTHIAALNGITTYALFGQTVREYGFAPLGNSTIIEVEDKLSCRPCGHLGHDACPKKHHDCMNLIEPESIIKAIREKI